MDNEIKTLEQLKIEWGAYRYNSACSRAMEAMASSGGTTSHDELKPSDRDGHLIYIAVLSSGK